MRIPHPVERTMVLVVIVFLWCAGMRLAGAQAPTPVRWVDPSMHSYTSPQEGCMQLWTTMQNQANASTPKGGVATKVLFQAYSNANTANMLAVKCNYILSTPSGNQQQAVTLRAMCGPAYLTPGNFLRSACAPPGTQLAPQAPAGNAPAGNPPAGNAPPQIASPTGKAQDVLSQAQNLRNTIGSIMSNFQTQAGNQQTQAQSAGVGQPFVSGNNAAGFAGGSGSMAPLQQPASNNSQAGAAAPATFRAGDFALTSYGCFHGSGRLLCDFDVTKQTYSPVNAAQLWSGMNLVGDGGQIVPHGNSYFVDRAGKPFAQGFLSAKPIRLIIEFADTGTQVSTVALLHGQEVVDNVPVIPLGVAPVDGSVAMRTANAYPVYAQAPAAVAGLGMQQPPQQAAQQPMAQPQPKANPVDQVNNAVDKTNSTVDKINGVKAAGQSLIEGFKKVKVK
jgi:hypothetical protein